MAAQSSGTQKAASLGKFTVEPSDDGFRMRIETDAGEVMDVIATRDQVDVIADALDDLLAASEEDDEAAED
ncbi:hypothetical protein [Alsobacter sp. SYSU BS001988]|jgi:hypothetical protein